MAVLLFRLLNGRPFLVTLGTKGGGPVTPPNASSGNDAAIVVAAL